MSKKAETKTSLSKKGTGPGKPKKPVSRRIKDEDLDAVSGGLASTRGSALASSVCISQT